MNDWSLEGLAERLRNLRPPEGGHRHAEEVAARRVYLARGESGEYELFLKGQRDSFAGVVGGRLMAWDEYHIVGSGQRLPALVVRTEGSERGIRLLAHVAYEACRLLENKPSLSNQELTGRLGPFFALVHQTELLSSQEQAGLMGELLFLHRLLNITSAEHAGRELALQSWLGPEGGLRDFYSNGTAVEVKSSLSGTSHRVQMEQLLVAADGSEDHLYLCSIRLRRDPSAPLRLPEQVRRVEESLLDNDLQQRFHEKLLRYGRRGYDASLSSQYRLEPGYFVDVPVLREISASAPVLRYSSFKDGEPPATVSRISYELDVSAIEPLAIDDERRVMLGLVGELGPLD